MLHEPKAFRLADGALKSVRAEVCGIRDRLSTLHSEHRGALKSARETGIDPKGLIVEGESSALLSTFKVTVKTKAGNLQAHFSIVYNADGQCCYLASPSDNESCQLISADGHIDRLPDIVRTNMYPSLVELMDALEADAEVSVQVEPAEEMGFGKPVIAEYARVGKDYKGERVLWTRPVADHRALMEQATAPRM